MTDLTGRISNAIALTTCAVEQWLAIAANLSRCAKTMLHTTPKSRPNLRAAFLLPPTTLL
jgi:hypothetical protein